MHVERFTTIRLPLEPAAALPLFTPEGVEVAYKLTALAPAGVEALEAVTSESFAADIAGWRDAIEELLARRTSSGSE